jgi:hypothetical protein
MGMRSTVLRGSHRLDCEVFFFSTPRREDAAGALASLEAAERPFIVVEDVRATDAVAVFPESEQCRAIILIVGELSCEQRQQLQMSLDRQVCLAKDFDAVMGWVF